MARIAGIDLPKDKRVEIGLTYIFGIGRTSANKILAEAKIDPDTRVKDLTEADEAKLREIIGNHYTVEGDLRRGDGHQAPDRNRLLPWHPAPQGPARPGPAQQDQRAHPEGSQAHRRQQEEVREGETHG